MQANTPALVVSTAPANALDGEGQASASTPDAGSKLDLKTPTDEDTTQGISPTASSSRRKALRSFLREHKQTLAGPREKVALVEVKESTTTRPLALRHLFKKPRVRQWYQDGKLMRTPAEHQSYRFELFFDLVFVGVLHAIAEQATDDIGIAAGSKIGTFVLSYYPAYIIWSDIRVWFNTAGSDDVLQRLVLLMTMFLLIGYTANVTAVSQGFADGSNDQGRSPFVAAVAFLLVGSLIRLVRLAIYAITLPRFRIYYLASALTTIVISAFFIPLCFVTDLTLFIVLPPVAFTTGFFAQASLAIWSWRMRHSEANKTHYVPAFASEHFIDRASDFVTLIFGETVLSSTYSAAQIGAQGEFGRAALAVSISFCLAWLYYAQSSARRFLHAIRRHPLSGIYWQTLHFGLSASLILTGASAGRLVTDDFEGEEGEASLSALRWTLGGSLAVTLVALAGIAHCHRPLDTPGSALLHREVRIAARYVCALINVLVPLAQVDNPTRVLAIHTGVTFFALFVEIFGKLGAWAPDDDERADEDEKLEGEAAHITRPSVGVL